MGEQDAGARSAPSTGADQSDVLRKLAGRLDGLTTGEVPRLIRPGEDGYGDGPALPVIDPVAYRAETGREWSPDLTAATAAPAVNADPPAAPQVEPAPPKAKPAQPKAGGPQGTAKAKPSSAKPPQGKGKGKARPSQGRPAQGRPAQQRQQAHANPAPARSERRPPPPRQDANARGARSHKRPGFWARLWAKLTGG